MTQTDTEHAFTLAELNRRFKIGRWTAERLIADGTFRATRTGTAKRSKWIVSARSVFDWLEGRAAATSAPIAISDAAPIPLSSLRYMDADERAEIQERRDAGELVERFIDGHPALVPA